VPGTRELIVTKTRYVVPYRVRGETVEILRVFHTSRRLPDRWWVDRSPSRPVPAGRWSRSFAERIGVEAFEVERDHGLTREPAPRATCSTHQRPVRRCGGANPTHSGGGE
jgi:hypothetical protein